MVGGGWEVGGGRRMGAHHPSTRPTTPGGFGVVRPVACVRTLWVFSHNKMQDWYTPPQGWCQPIQLTAQISNTKVQCYIVHTYLRTFVSCYLFFGCMYVYSRPSKVLSYISSYLHSTYVHSHILPKVRRYFRTMLHAYIVTYIR